MAVASSAFTKAEANHLKLQVGEQRDVNFTLVIAGQTQSVLVTSELPLLETTRTDTSTVIDDKSVADLPTTTAFNISGTAGVNGISNDYAGLPATAPGVTNRFIRF